MKISILSALSILAFVGATAITQSRAITENRSVADRSDATDKAAALDDATFLKKLAQGGIAEVEVGKLAVKQANDPEVKAFARRMVDDHTKANEKLKSLADKHQVSLPTVVDPDQSAAKSKLEMQNTSTFDAEYMSAQVKDHEQTVELLRHAIAQGKDAGVKQFAKETLPTVAHHLEAAKQLLAKLTSKKSGSTVE